MKAKKVFMGGDFDFFLIPETEFEADFLRDNFQSGKKYLARLQYKNGDVQGLRIEEVKNE